MSQCPAEFCQANVDKRPPPRRVARCLNMSDSGADAELLSVNQSAVVIFVSEGSPPPPPSPLPRSVKVPTWKRTHVTCPTYAAQVIFESPWTNARRGRDKLHCVLQMQVQVSVLVVNESQSSRTFVRSPELAHLVILSQELKIINPWIIRSTL